MKNLLKITIILFFSFFFLISCDEADDKKSESKNPDEIRLENADSSQKACVKTLGQGVYKDKSLSWKLDSCNVPK